MAVPRSIANSPTRDAHDRPTPINSSKRVLEPNERIAEVLFGLIMVLTLASVYSSAQPAAEPVDKGRP